MANSSPHPASVGVFLAENDLTARLSLTHFFSVVFGCETRAVSDLCEAARLLPSVSAPDMVVLGLRKPDGPAFEVIRAAIALDPKPFVLALMDEAGSDAAVSLFEAGADEVVHQPFSLKELAYRLRSRLGKLFTLDAGRIGTLELAADIVDRAELTDIEAQVVRVLMGHEGQIVSRDALSLAIDRAPWTYGDRKFDVHVARIRKKLETAYGNALTVQTIRAAGYQLTLTHPTA
ncbi:response regulator transcription factor [Aestuariivita sp.]|jgi:DNA-binding response OmpR family regulator|uniref:response regulator transcription factor n=1 Tax=Aestuariivita sp. TaxID=1872407 RepID=UPI00216BC3C7|nr:response regulator transcription factor [Aestuariivita sp.]MCE8008954.1 response regulator transcription factor [Aestuariivita sp.]